MQGNVSVLFLERPFHSFLPSSKQTTTSLAARHAILVRPAPAAAPQPSLPLSLPGQPEPVIPIWSHNASSIPSSSQAQSGSSAHTTSTCIQADTRQPYHVHCQLEPPCSINGDGSSRKEQQSRSASASSDRASDHAEPRTAGKSSRQVQLSTQDQLQQKQQTQQGSSVPPSVGFGRDAFLHAIKDASTTLELQDVCQDMDAACLSRQQGLNKPGKSAGASATSQHQHQKHNVTRLQQQALPASAPQPQHLHNIPPAAIIKATAAKLYQLLGRDSVSSRGEPQEPTDSSHKSTQSRSERDRQQQQQESGWQPQQNQGVMPHNVASLEYRQAVRTVCQLMCRWIEGCVASGLTKKLQQDLATGRLLLCLARGVQVAGPSCVIKSTAPALLVSLLLHSCSGTPSAPAAGRPHTSTHKPLPVSPPNQIDAAKGASQHPLSGPGLFRAGEGSHVPQVPSNTEQHKPSFKQPGAARSLAPHHIASIAWAAAVIRPRHFLCLLPDLGTGGAGDSPSGAAGRKADAAQLSNGGSRGGSSMGGHTSRCRSSSSSSSSTWASQGGGVQKWRRGSGSLLGELLCWLYGVSEPVLGHLSTSQLVQLLWGMAKLRQPLPKRRAGIVLKQNALPSRLRAYLLVSKTRAALSKRSNIRQKGSNFRGGRRRGRSPTTHIKRGHVSSQALSARLPCPPASWWGALEAATTLSSQPFQQLPQHQNSNSLSSSLAQGTPVHASSSRDQAVHGSGHISCQGSSKNSEIDSNSKIGQSSLSSFRVVPTFKPPLLAGMSAAELALFVWGLGGLARPQPRAPRLKRLIGKAQDQHQQQAHDYWHQQQSRLHHLPQQSISLTPPPRQSSQNPVPSHVSAPSLHQMQQQRQNQQQPTSSHALPLPYQSQQQHHTQQPSLNHVILILPRSAPNLQLLPPPKPPSPAHSPNQSSEAHLLNSQQPEAAKPGMSSGSQQGQGSLFSRSQQPEDALPGISSGSQQGQGSVLSHSQQPKSASSRRCGQQLNSPPQHSQQQAASNQQPPNNLVLYPPSDSHHPQHTHYKHPKPPSSGQVLAPHFTLPDASFPPCSQMQPGIQHTRHPSPPPQGQPDVSTSQPSPQGQPLPSNQPHPQPSMQASMQASLAPPHSQRHRHQQAPSNRILHQVLTSCCRILEASRQSQALAQMHLQNRHAPLLARHQLNSSHRQFGGPQDAPSVYKIPSSVSVSGANSSSIFAPEYAAMLLRGLATLQCRPPPVLLFNLLLRQGLAYSGATTAGPGWALPLGTGSVHSTPLQQGGQGLKHAEGVHLPQAAQQQASLLAREGAQYFNPNLTFLGSRGHGMAPRPQLSNSSSTGLMWNTLGSSSKSIYNDKRSSSALSNLGALSSAAEYGPGRVRRPGIAHQLQMLESAQALEARPPPAVMQSLERDFKDHLSASSAAQLVLHARALLKVGLRTPSRELLMGWMEEVHTKRKRLTPLQTVQVLQLLAEWDMYPGLPWLSDILDTVAAALPCYSRSCLVDLLEALAALQVRLDTSFQPKKKVAKRRLRGAKEEHTSKVERVEGSSVSSSERRGEVNTSKGKVRSDSTSTCVSASKMRSGTSYPPLASSSSSSDGSSDAQAITNTLPPPSSVLTRRAPWLRSVLRTFKSRRHPTARVDQLDRLQAVLRRLCTPELLAAVDATLQDAVVTTAPSHYRLH